MSVEVRKQLLATLKRIDRPGTFCASGRLPSTIPGLEVTGAGSVSLPLEKRQAAALKKCAHQAPYGKGTQTLVDTTVRRVWEIDADHITLANPEWQQVVEHAMLAVKTELGLAKQQLDAHLYKLLLYEAGSFFLSHRDGEKVDRMVATLVITLPSAHEGGELIVRHDGREVTVDFGPDSRFQTQFAAFYADCEHEVRPVTSGFRLALVYNLTLAKSKQAIAAPTSREHIAAVTRILGQGKIGNGGSRMPGDSETDHPANKLAVVLDHEYTQAGLTYDALKGIDRAKAHVLFTAAHQIGWDVSLALVTKWVSGSAEPSGDYGYGYGYGYGRSRRRGRYWQDDADDDTDAGEHEMGEVFDESLKAEHFSDADGNRLPFGQIPFNDDEIVSETPLSEWVPDKEDFEGYTGNAGMTLERWYHRAAIVLWPSESRFDVLCESGVEAAVGGLEQMVRRWKKAGKTEQESLRPPCLKFARQIIVHWPERIFGYGDHVDYDAENNEEFLSDNHLDDDGDDPGEFDEDHGRQEHQTSPKCFGRHLLSLLAELGDVSLMTAWLRGVLAKDVSVDPGETLGDLCQEHGWTTFQVELRELFENTSNETLERQAQLLAEWSLRRDTHADRKKLCSQLAQQLISAVEHWNPDQAKSDWRARKVNRSELLPPLTQTFLALEQPELFERLVTHILDRPHEFDLTTVQVPALLHLETWLRRKVQRSCSPLHRWLSAVHAKLDSRASHPPQEPADWRRESATGCECADCRELGRFLKDPHMETIRLPLAQHRRQHLHHVIDRKGLDTTHVTERRGRPYTLVCTKTNASYERALKAHRVDLDHLKKIRSLLAWHSSLNADTNPPAQKAAKSKTAKSQPRKRK